MAKFLAQRLCSAALRCQAQGRLGVRESRVFGAVSQRTADFHNSPRLLQETSANTIPQKGHAPSDMDKRILVWHGSYDSMADVPKEVSASKMKKAKDFARIRVNIYIMLVTSVACVITIYFYHREDRQFHEKVNLLEQEHANDNVTKMKTARDWARIRINIGMIFTTVLACGLMMFLGKRAQARGESVTQMNRDWHAKQKEGSQGK